MIGCLEAGIDWLLVLRQAVRHLLERYTASRVDVDSDKVRLTELYTAHDAVDSTLEHDASLKDVDSTLAEHNSKESRDEMWRKLALKHPGFFKNESEQAAGGPLQIYVGKNP